jgi:N-hydroxyarylamine O-acetyltransferase
MSNLPIDVDAYLERIAYQGPTDISIETLRALHTAHAMAVPFENLDIHLGRPILLDAAAIFDKIVNRRRGGYCFEMNGLMTAVLRQLGFSVQTLAARVMLGSAGVRAKTHQMQRVTVDGEPFVVDVGFGGNGLLAPLRLQTDTIERQYSESFRLTEDERFGYVLEALVRDRWQKLYAFTLEEHLRVDYELMNYYTSTSPDALFTQVRICTKPTPEGRVTLTGMELKIRRGEQSETSYVADEEAYRQALEEHFGIVLDGPFVAPNPPR